MIFDSYIVSDTKTSLSMPLAYPPQKELKRSKDFKRFAFTLAETLITLTIIGVVAALTVPNLLNKYTKHTYVVGLKKAYSQLQNAIKMIPITEGCSAGDYDCAKIFTSDTSKALNTLGKQFKTIAICDSDYSKEICQITKENEHDLTHTGGYMYNFTTEDGMIYQLFHTWASNNLYDLEIGVDVNGKKGPNIRGRDRFMFFINAQEQNGIAQGTLIPNGSKLESILYDNQNAYWRTATSEYYECTSNINPKNYSQNFACTGRVLEEDAMNY